MNWKNPIRVFAVAGWLMFRGFVLLGWAGFRVFQGFLLLGWVVFRVAQIRCRASGSAATLFLRRAVGWAGWSFVHRPFPPLDEHPILASGRTTTPQISSMLWVVLWYYVTPFAVVMLTGLYFRHHLEGLAGRAAERFRILLQTPAVAA